PVDPAPPAGDPEAAHFEQVSVQIPKLRLNDVPADRADIVGEVLGIEGVAFATAMTVGEVAVAAADGVTGVRVAAVDPAGFRVLTPQVTADAVEVWQRISEGDAAFIHDVGQRLALELGQRLPAAGHTTLRVGALASNGAPPVADAIVSSDMGEHLRLEGTKSVLISLAGDQSASDVAERIEGAIGLVPEVLEQPQTQRAFLSGSAARNAFEPFSYVSFGDGMIQIDSNWVRRNIVRADVPILGGQVVCHRLLIPQLRGALQEIKDRGLAHLIDTSQYGGCWVPRHILFDPGRGLSMHAWGLAVDINVSTNGYGATPQMDPRIVEVFDRWGFVWGGRWSTPDGMHFELGAIMQGGG
ncbi:MAG TPA: M15 family metallopeptidase, partial [Egibacteraceae bacterium]|nr:M15 family metallopeptidase [Egibacteraceae bacterium]